MPKLIEVQNLTKEYGGMIAVDDLNFKIYNGKIYGLFGAEGAGKTTTLHLLAGCLVPTEGSVRINGFDLAQEPRSAKQCIGYLPDELPFPESLTPYEFLCFVAEAKGVSYERAQRQVHEALELCMLDELKERMIKRLSAYDRRRLGLAQALLGSPDILLLDEPTTGLDADQATEILDLIRHIGESKTVILSSHIAAEIKALCHHVLVLSEGTLIANAAIEELAPEALSSPEGSTPATKKVCRADPEYDGEYELIEVEAKEDEEA